jgi:subtilisin family serine protease
MPVEVPIPLVEFILLGPRDDRRQLQDSPILGDVWVAYAKTPSEPLDLLVTPNMTQHAGHVAEAIEAEVAPDVVRRANVAYLQGIVAAKLTFAEVLTTVVPLTKWWNDRWVVEPRTAAGPADPGIPARHAVDAYDLKRITAIIEKILKAAAAWPPGPQDPPTPDFLPIERYIALTGLILWAGTRNPSEADRAAEGTLTAAARMKRLADAVPPADVAGVLADIVRQVRSHPRRQPALVWHVSLNRTASPALTRSIPAVKGDAARTLFKVNCRDVAWAVIDSGIDGNHPAFNAADGTSRVLRCFDFTQIRKVVSLSNARDEIRRDTVREIMDRRDLLKPPRTGDAADADLKQLASDVKSRRPIHWELVERFVELAPTTPPPSHHGTHVAGIIGASKEAAEATLRTAGGSREDCADGMCPDIQLYDFRVLGPSIRDTEFAIIAALQFIRHLNERDNFFSIHGVNLSLSIPHDVRNFACGRTPICNECERLVESGVVVVAAAGNHGYKSFETQEGAFESYAAFSITDPGNADSIITVGATHRYWPHTYGVSFFSSRGPTGDGRLKPDLVAPGERIRAPMPGGEAADGGQWGDLDGTSMAAPHVSGAAAMLMARYSELIGQPRRIKRILCETATDLGRERSFQGHGMLDVLRAFQSL